MADPISLAAIAGLIFAGRTLSNKPQPQPQPQPVVEEPPLIYNDDEEVREIVEREFEPRVEIPQKMEMASFADIGRQQRSGGQEILNMRNRMYDTGRMNNLSPIEKQMVGPGLGLSADTPAQGGYQQMFRVNPINVGEYRLTTLPGRSGPAADTTGGRGAVVGQLTHNKPETTAFLPSRLPAMPGRAQGMSGATPRASHQKTMRTTNRSETGLRTDGLDRTPGKRFVPGQTMPQAPTRNKMDVNDSQFMHVNNPSPGIANFYGGYVNAPAAMINSEGPDSRGYGVDQYV